MFLYQTIRAAWRTPYRTQTTNYLN